MNDKEQVIKHLEITQGVINRLANNSFLIKGWSMTILAAAILFISRSSNHSDYLILLFIIPVAGFWILDGYFLWQERLFRGIYEDVRLKTTTDFKMDISSQLRKPKNQWHHSIFSVTLNIFYSTELFFLVIAFISLKCSL